jgi:hypothetical protein
MTSCLAAVHESGLGTRLTKRMPDLRPQLAKADMRALTGGSGFDPLRKSGGQNCCNAHTAFHSAMW